MKTVIAVMMAALLPAAAFSQSLTVEAGYAKTKLFEIGPNAVIQALGATDSSVFYLQSSSGVTTLMRRDASDFGAEVPALFTFDSSVVGSFVKVAAGQIVFGETHGPFDDPVGSIWTVPVDGSAAAHKIAEVTGNYDLAFRGTDAFLSAYDTAAFSNKVFRFALDTGTQTILLDTGGDYSGPIAFLANGDLLYGATAFGGNPDAANGGIFRFTAQEIDDAFANTTILALSDGDKIVNNGTNGYFAVDGNSLLQARNPFDQDFRTTGLIEKIDLATLAVSHLGETQIDELIGGIDVHNGELFAVATSNYFSGPSSVYKVTSVPEPAVALFGLIGGAALLGGRRHRPGHLRRAGTE